VGVVVGRSEVLLWWGPLLFIYSVGARSAEVRAAWRRDGFPGRRDMIGDDEEEDRNEEVCVRRWYCLIWMRPYFTVTTSAER
jgi:hypothetical protein